MPEDQPPPPPDPAANGDPFVVLSAVIDNANTQYQVEWQRVGNMQQSAGALVAAIAIVFSAIVAFLSLKDDSSAVRDTAYVNGVLLPLLAFALTFLSLATVFFFRVVWPGKVKGLPLPAAMYEDLGQKALWQAMGEVIAKCDVCIGSVHDHVQGKQRDYRRALIACAAAFAGVAVLIIALLIRLPWIGSLDYLFYCLLGVAAVVAIGFMFFLKGDGDGRQAG